MRHGSIHPVHARPGVQRDDRIADPKEWPVELLLAHLRDEGVLRAALTYQVEYLRAWHYHPPPAVLILLVAHEHDGDRAWTRTHSLQQLAHHLRGDVERLYRAKVKGDDPAVRAVSTHQRIDHAGVARDDSAGGRGARRLLDQMLP